MRRLALLFLVGFTAAACGGSATGQPLRVADTYLGLDCGNAFPCPHLGIALWLKAPESRVTVTLHGRRVTLSTRDRRFWKGFVRDKIAERLAVVDDMSRTVRLTVEAVDLHGTVRRTQLVSPVSPGWG